MSKTTIYIRELQNKYVETMEQKGATQVETSTLDEQKPVDTTTNRTIDLEKPNKIEERRYT